MSKETLEAIRQSADRYPPETFFSTDQDRKRFLEWLRPRPGLAMGLADMRECGMLGWMFPAFHAVADRGTREARHPAVFETHALLAIQHLERLPGEATLDGERFGAMLRELSAPELLVLSLLLHHVGQSRYEHNVEDAVRGAKTSLAPLQLEGNAREMVEFLIRNQAQMSQVAFRQDAGDPDIVAAFAALLNTAAQLNTFNTEEHLKMLCLMTVADLGGTGADTLTPWKSELLWRLFVDTYNHLTMAYGDEVIDQNAATRTALHANRPHDITEADLTRFLEGLPKRYLTLFDPVSIYQHVRLSHDIGPNDVHLILNRKSDLWELTVVSLDKPYLFSNISGVLSYLDLDILRGQALTSLSSLVLDVFQFRDHAGFLAHSKLEPFVSDVIAGRRDITALLKEKARRFTGSGIPHPPPIIYFDNDASHRYTVLEIVAHDAPGLLHRISGVISRYGLNVELVLISTEGDKAIDVFHLKNGEQKLTDSDQLALTEDLERTLEDDGTR